MHNSRVQNTHFAQVKKKQTQRHVILKRCHQGFYGSLVSPSFSYTHACAWKIHIASGFLWTSSLLILFCICERVNYWGNNIETWVLELLLQPHKSKKQIYDGRLQQNRIYPALAWVFMELSSEIQKVFLCLPSSSPADVAHHPCAHGCVAPRGFSAFLLPPGPVITNT